MHDIHERAERNERLNLCDSYERPMILWQEMVAETDPRIRIALFLAHWKFCDAPWAMRSYIADVVRRSLAQVSLAECLRGQDLEWYQTLPAEIEVYRGCEELRERGISWTTDIEVAKAFADGKRCRNRFPTLARARIPKRHVFGVFTGRKEHEIAVDPRRLRRLEASPLRTETVRESMLRILEA